MKRPFKEFSAGKHGTATTFAALVLAALVPAVCVLWFMTMAMRNERLAVQQRLTDVYFNHLASAQRQLAAFWKDRQGAIQFAANGPPAEIFAMIVASNLADSVIVYDSAGKVAYPVPVTTPVAGRVEESAEWALARELEFQKTNFLDAAAAYRRFAQQASDIGLRAKAIRSQAGCLLKAGQKESAIDLLTKMIRDTQFHEAVGELGVLVVPNVQLLVLKLLHDPTNETYRQTFKELVNRLNDYGDALLSASQRRFLMEELRMLEPDAAVFRTLAAEQLAADYLERHPEPPREPVLQSSLLPGIWRLSAPSGAVLALFREDRLRAQMATVLNTFSLPDVGVKVLGPAEPFSPTRLLPPFEVGETLPGWRLALSFKGPDPFAAASARQTRIYLWSGVIVVLIIALTALAAGRYVGAQMRLARLKNDLVSTVSHELKTPLASMRALVDTLLAGRYHDEQQLVTYLKLAAQENQRLSHLIDNFLTFSRLERNKQQLQYEEVKIEGLVNNAVTALRDRFDPIHCRLEVKIAPGLPNVQGDSEALTTVLINLLDNAFKYTQNDKHIVLSACLEHGAVALAVKDNGIGLTDSESKKIFDRFYQVDQSLSRQTGGCGLGLSIVQSIVKAHGGSVAVTSEPGKGSTFTVRLPLAEPLDVGKSG